MRNRTIVRLHSRRERLGVQLSYLLLLSTALTPALAFAQDAGSPVQEPSAASSPQEPDPSEQQATGGTGQLQDIVVTAQRREQRLQDVPIAVSAFDSVALQARGATTVKDLAQVDASLNIAASAGVYLPFLRGVGNIAGGPVGNESSVAVYIDDVYYTRLSQAYLALGSIDRVEVLKGPQGTLFGRNASGGAIQMFTRDPTQDAELIATVGYANYDTISGQLYASLPITDTLSWNIAFGGSHQRDGWGRSITTGLDAYVDKHATVRSKLLWEPTDRTRVKIVGFYAYQKGDLGFTQDRHEGSYSISPPVPLPGYPNPPLVLPSLADVPGDNFYNNRLNVQSAQTEEGYGGSIRIDQEAGFADFVSITAFRNSDGNGFYDSDYSAQNFILANLTNVDNQFTQEIQVKSKADSTIDWIIGGYYLSTRQGYNPAQVFGDLLTVAIAPGAVQNLYGIQKVRSLSAYGQATAPLATRTNLTLGLRFTNDRVSGRGRETATIPGVGEIPLGPEFRDRETFNRLTWKGSLDHHFADDVMGYASVSRGFKAGTFNTLGLNRAPARPEIVDAYEIGFKSDLFDRRVRLNGAVFWNEIKNPQVITFFTTGLTGGVGLTNAQKARVKGGEFSIEAIAADGLNLRASATYLDAKYVRFNPAPFYSLNERTLVGPVAGDAGGNRLLNVPEWRFALGANYTRDTGIGRFVGDVGLAYTGRFPWNADNRVTEDPVTLVNASLNFTPASRDDVTFSFWGKNLAGVEYYSISQEATFPGGVGGDIAAAAAPRTYGGAITVRF